jgi:glutathione S-transferase
MGEIVLYDAKVSGNAYKVRLALAQLDLPHRVVPVDLLKGEARAEEFRGMNPFGRVPFLVDGDLALAESNAILIHLTRGTPLWPSDHGDEMRALQWMFFEQNQVEASIAVIRFFVRFAPHHERRPAAEDLLHAKGVAALATLDHHLERHEFVVDCYSAADIALFGYVHVAPEGGFSLDPYPAIIRWMRRVRAQPGFIGMDE